MGVVQIGKDLEPRTPALLTCLHLLIDSLLKGRKFVGQAFLDEGQERLHKTVSARRRSLAGTEKPRAINVLLFFGNDIGIKGAGRSPTPRP